MTPDLQALATVASIALSGLNLVFILKILFNDLHYLRDLLEKHLDYSAEKDLKVEGRLSVLESKRPAG